MLMVMLRTHFSVRLCVLLFVLSFSTNMLAQFHPDSPPDPETPTGPPAPVPQYLLTVRALPAEGGTVSGGGHSYEAGTSVKVKTTRNANYTFLYWENRHGEVVSNQLEFSHVTAAEDDTLTARFRFTPGSPADSTEPVFDDPDSPDPVYYQLVLKVQPTEGGTVRGGGSYLPGTAVTLRASTNANYTFLGWFKSDGTTLVYTQAQVSHVTAEQADTLVARWKFSPGSPTDPETPEFPEPTVPTPVHTLQVSVLEGGTARVGNTNVATNTSTTISLQENATTTLRATPEASYVFTGWYQADTLYTQAASFTFRMDTCNHHLQARFRFQPSSPNDPSTPATSQYAFYLMNRVGKPGDLLRMPIYFTSLDSLRDVSFQLTFPSQLMPDMSSVTFSAKAQGYDLQTESVNDTTWVFNLSGGITPPGNTALVTVSVPIPENMETGVSFPVRINQVTVMQTNGESVAASTRNGRLSVYMYGDTNGDNVIDLQDKRNLIVWLLSQTTEDYYEEVWDVNNDGEVTVTDAMRIVEIIDEQEGRTPVQAEDAASTESDCLQLLSMNSTAATGTDDMVMVHHGGADAWAFQVDIQLPDGLLFDDQGGSPFSLSPERFPASAEGHHIDYARLPNGWWRIIVSPDDSTRIVERSGAVATARYASSLAEGLHPIHAKRQVIALDGQRAISPDASVSYAVAGNSPLQAAGRVSLPQLDGRMLGFVVDSLNAGLKGNNKLTELELTEVTAFADSIRIDNPNGLIVVRQGRGMDGTRNVVNILSDGSAACQWLDLNETGGAFWTSRSFYADRLTLHRPMVSGHWNTLCLPFALSRSDVQKLFGNSARVGQFAGFEVNGAGEQQLRFTPTEETLQSNTPYILRTGQLAGDASLSDFQLHDVAVAEGAEQQVTVGDFAFKGTYEPGNTVPVGDYYIYNSMFYQSQGLSTINAFRGWFHRSDSGVAGARIIRLFFADDENETATEISLHRAEAVAPTIYYNLGGQRVSSPQHGVYISRGKKMLVK